VPQGRYFKVMDPWVIERETSKAAQMFPGGGSSPQASKAAQMSEARGFGTNQQEKDQEKNSPYSGEAAARGEIARMAPGRVFGG
jgi:hypothetical protein